jgi:hypothetical protein
VFISEPLGRAQGGGVVGMIGREILDPDKAMTVYTKDIGSIIPHGIAPLRLMLG